MIGGCVDTIPYAPDPDAPRLPQSLQEQLPVELYLSNLCPSAETPPRLLRMLRRQANVLLRERERRPDWLLTYTFYFENSEPDTHDITVRQLAELQLQDLKTGDELERELTGRPCEPGLIRRLEEALD